MVLHIDRAYSDAQFRALNPESYCDSFWLASQNTTENIGAAFARSLSYRSPDDMAAQPSIRIGIAGAADVGKSTFVRGFESALTGALTLERLAQRSAKNSHILEPVSWFSSSLPPKEFTQSLKVTKEMGAVLHRDALWNKMFKDSRLSNFDAPHRYGQVHVELIEHPYADANKNFDCVIIMAEKRDWSLATLFNHPRALGRAAREMSVFASEEFRNTARFRALQTELRAYSTNFWAAPKAR